MHGVWVDRRVLPLQYHTVAAGYTMAGSYAMAGSYTMKRRKHQINNSDSKATPMLEDVK